MKNKQLKILIIIIVFGLFTSTSGTLFASGIEGEGTEDSPYLIRTLEDLYSISTNSASYYKLMNDLDFDGMRKEALGTFKGVLDGDGHAIKNLIISGSVGANNIGLFSSLVDSKIIDITFENITVTASGINTGIICGIASNSTFENVNLINTTVSGVKNTGGISGSIETGNITNCHAIGGKVYSSNNQNTGGMIGYANKVIMHSSSSTTKVESGYIIIGGLIGLCKASQIEECFVKADVKGQNYIGGLIGFTEDQNTYIKNCYFIGLLDSSAANANTYTAAGICNYHDHTPSNIISCYTVATINSRTAKSGIAPENIKSVNCYFNEEISNITTPANQARTTALMYKKLNYMNWDFETVWIIEDGMGYPKLRNELRENPPKPEKIPLESISLEPAQAKLSVGDSMSINLVFLPDNTSNKNVTWLSSNPASFVVDDNGVVTAVSEGYGAIMVLSEDGSKVAYCNILIIEASISQNIALPATAYSNSESSSTYRASKSNDGDYETRWLAKTNSINPYLEIDFGQEESFRKIKLSEFAERINEFSLQIWNETEWVDIYTGNGVGSEFEVDFHEVTSNKVRLIVLSTFTSYGPSIYEFEVWN